MRGERRTNIQAIEAIVKSPLRKSLFHFTRASNLHSAEHFDALFSSRTIAPSLSEHHRDQRCEVEFEGQRFVVNAHLKISEAVMHPDTSLRQFRIGLDQHVFFWPTLRDCQKMLNTYTRREPDEKFAILQLDARSMLYGHYSRIKLSKYDSGSSPRYPNLCSYKKSLRMFLPIARFGLFKDNLVPTKPSEIREVLVEGEVSPLSKYLKSVYVSEIGDVPEQWRRVAKSLREFQAAD